MPRHTGFLMVGLLLVAAASLGCAGQQAPSTPGAGTGSEPKYGGIAVFAGRGDPSGSWDPMFVSTITLGSVANSGTGQGNLVKYCRDNEYKICGFVAESWEPNPDFTQWTFKIRDKVYWHDGVPFTAADAKFWLDLSFNGIKVGDKTRPPASYKGAMGDMKQVEVLDPQRLRVTLGSPTPFYLDLLALPSYTIAHPRHLMQPLFDKGEVMAGPKDVGWVGLGPYRTVSHEKGSLVQARRSDNYWEKDERGNQLPYLDGIDFPIITDPSAVVAAFRAGRLDGGARGGGFQLNPEQIEGIKRSLGADQVQFLGFAGTRWHLWFNVLKPGPWQDVRVRRAISLWMDRRAGVQAVTGGLGYLTPMLAPESPYTDPDWKTWPGYNEATRTKDRDEAKRLMAEAGYANGFTMQHQCRPVWVYVCEWIQGDLAGLGIKLPFSTLDDATYSTSNLSITDWDTRQVITNTTFPEGLTATLNRHSLSRSAAPKHEDPKIPEFFARFDRAKSQEERTKIFRELERYVLLDQVYGISMFEDLMIHPYRSYVQGLFPQPEDPRHNNDYATVWLNK